MSKKIYYQFDGTDQIFWSEEYNLELNANGTRSELGLPYWTDYKIIENDRITDNPNSDIKALSPSDDNSSHQEPTSVSPSVKKTKLRKKAV
jgi:hypothetical protein